MRKILEIEVLADYIMNIVFETGEKKAFDLKPYIQNGVFKELQNESYLRSVKNRGYFVEWPHEQDLSSDTLYIEGLAL